MRDPGIFARGGVGGGGGVPGLTVRNVVFFPQLILQFYRGCPMVIPMKNTTLKGSRGGGPTFSRRVGAKCK